MARPARKRGKSKSDDSEKVQFRLPLSLIKSLDTWAAELNQKKPWPPTTRSELVRRSLQWAVDRRPNLGLIPEDPHAPEAPL